MVIKTSGKIGGYVFADRDWPSVRFHSFNVSEAANPIGTRNLVSGSFAFNKIVGLHTANPLEFRNLILDFTNTVSGLYQSTTECLIFRQTNNRYTLSNLRFWMPSGSALTPSGHIEFITDGRWQYNYHIPSGVGGAIPTALPSLPNLNRCNGLGYISASDDTDVSEFIYMVVTVMSGYSLGRYGYGGTGTLAFKLTYDIFDNFTY